MRAPPRDADPLRRLIAIMARLRDPADGCAWDLEQTFATISPYTIEEAYEVSDAIDRGDMGEIRDELGDLLLQVVFHARMAEEAGAFSFEDVAAAICDKMIRRHPHVFGEAGYRNATEQTVAWDAIKAEERAAKDASQSLLDGVPAALPALMRAEKLTRRAARVGFTWATPDEVIEKLHEELGELTAEIESGDRAKMRDEMGDLLFVCANLARLLELDPEDALRAANAKFTRRFNVIETTLAAEGRSPEDADLAEMDGLWNAAKRAERG